MTTISFSATSSAIAATSLSVALGGTPNVGDLVVVWLGVSNEIVTHQPGYNTTNEWFKMEGIRSRVNTSTFSSYYHTWNASDSGSSVTFTFSPAPSLGIGDKDLSSASAVAIAVVLAGPVGLKEHTAQGLMEPEATCPSSPLKKTLSSAFQAVYSLDTTSYTNSDSGASLVSSISAAGQTLYVWVNAAPQAPYSALFTSPGYEDTQVLSSGFLDAPAFLYNPPFIEEGPVAEDSLFYRYKLNRYYTVMNNAGVFSAQRYLSTDQITAATQTFTNNTPVTSTDRTNILNSGVGGDFVST